jgi:putative hydrolase of the HAD superfamily
MSSSPGVLLLDIGGVLLRLRPWREAFAELAAKLPPAALRALAQGVEDFKRSELFLRHERGQVSSLDFIAGLRRAFAIDGAVDEAAIIRAYERVLGEPIAGMEELIAARQAAGWRVCALSDISRLHLALLPRYASVRRMERVVASCETGFLKPEPQAFAEALRRIGARAEEVVFVDDREANAEGGRRAGLTSIVFESPAALDRALDALDGVARR